ncbi:hypothetical protein KEM55_008527 [Ascosphaera atra]|nr:hypothetical protein KEM55_008527 [Ascosphaera atra]
MSNQSSLPVRPAARSPSVVSVSSGPAAEPAPAAVPAPAASPALPSPSGPSGVSSE